MNPTQQLEWRLCDAGCIIGETIIKVLPKILVQMGNCLILEPAGCLFAGDVVLHNDLSQGFGLFSPAVGGCLQGGSTRFHIYLCLEWKKLSSGHEWLMLLKADWHF